ncbi:MAG: hypothetical protein IJS14_05490 [Lentisphaeria bacterium]|nr:hypothetical protein [Lentisphaeria bacterium]
MRLEVAGARQTLGNRALAFFPFFQFLFPERIAERAVGKGSFHRLLAVGGKRAENENQKNCRCQNSHSLILLDNPSNNNSAIYFEKTKCQEEKQIIAGQSRDRSAIFVRMVRRDAKKYIVFGFRSCFSRESRYISSCLLMDHRQMDAICPVRI